MTTTLLPSIVILKTFDEIFKVTHSDKYMEELNHIYNDLFTDDDNPILFTTTTNTYYCNNTAAAAAKNANTYVYINFNNPVMICEPVSDKSKNTNLDHIPINSKQFINDNELYCTENYLKIPISQLYYSSGKQQQSFSVQLDAIKQFYNWAGEVILKNATLRSPYDFSRVAIISDINPYCFHVLYDHLPLHIKYQNKCYVVRRNANSVDVESSKF